MKHFNNNNKKKKKLISSAVCFRHSFLSTFQTKIFYQMFNKCKSEKKYDKLLLLALIKNSDERE